MSLGFVEIVNYTFILFRFFDLAITLYGMMEKLISEEMFALPGSAIRFQEIPYLDANKNVLTT